MKMYTFDMKNKSENIKTHRNDTVFDFMEYRIFNQHTVGFKRDWKVLATHNTVKYVKRILNSSYPYMLSYFNDTTGDMAEYLVYIDFGKYRSQKDTLVFTDLELDILITKDLRYYILDMDELYDSYQNKRMSQEEFQNVLMSLQKIINDFSKYGVIETLKNYYGADSINWLTEEK